MGESVMGDYVECVGGPWDGETRWADPRLPQLAVGAGEWLYQFGVHGAIGFVGDGGWYRLEGNGPAARWVYHPAN